MEIEDQKNLNEGKNFKIELRTNKNIIIFNKHINKFPKYFNI